MYFNVIMQQTTFVLIRGPWLFLIRSSIVKDLKFTPVSGALNSLLHEYAGIKVISTMV